MKLQGSGSAGVNFPCAHPNPRMQSHPVEPCCWGQWAWKAGSRWTHPHRTVALYSSKGTVCTWSVTVVALSSSRVRMQSSRVLVFLSEWMWLSVGWG